MNNEPFYQQRSFDEYGINRESWRESSPVGNVRHDTVPDDNDIDGQPLDPVHTFDDARGVSSFEYDDRMVGGSGDRRGAHWSSDTTDTVGQVQDDFVRSKDRQSARPPRQDDKYSSKYRDYSDDVDRKSRSRSYGYGTEDPSGRGRQRSRSRERDRVRNSRDRERSKDRDRRSRRDDCGYGNEREDSEYRSRRRSRSRDRDRDRDRDRRYRDTDRDRRHRDLDRDRPRRDHVRDRESSSKEIPWVPPPLPEHLRHLQVQWALTPVDGAQQSSSSAAGILGAAPLPCPQVQNQFQNDGSFLEMFRQKMQQQQPQQGVPVSDNSNTCEGPATSGTGAVVEEAPTAAVPAPALPANSSGLPVIARRRISKILKTGIVQKKKKEEEEEPEKEAGDGWSSYMKEVQRYRANKCIENEASRPSLVK